MEIFSTEFEIIFFVFAVISLGLGVVIHLRDDIRLPQWTQPPRCGAANMGISMAMCILMLSVLMLRRSLGVIRPYDLCLIGIYLVMIPMGIYGFLFNSSKWLRAVMFSSRDRVVEKAFNGALANFLNLLETGFLTAELKAEYLDAYTGIIRPMIVRRDRGDLSYDDVTFVNGIVKSFRSRAIN
jgi:hypothetical protein